MRESNLSRRATYKRSENADAVHSHAQDSGHWWMVGDKKLLGVVTPSGHCWALLQPLYDVISDTMHGTSL